jgi:hypothetical protein
MANSAVGDAAGAAAAGTVVHVPMLELRSHRWSGALHGESQQTSSAQNNPATHCEATLQPPPCGTGVGVLVAVDVFVAVPVFVAVGVLVAVDVLVGVDVGVGTQSTRKTDEKAKTSPGARVKL